MKLGHTWKIVASMLLFLISGSAHSLGRHNSDEPPTLAEWKVTFSRRGNWPGDEPIAFARSPVRSYKLTLDQTRTLKIDVSLMNRSNKTVHDGQISEKDAASILEVVLGATAEFSPDGVDQEGMEEVKLDVVMNKSTSFHLKNYDCTDKWYGDFARAVGNCVSGNASVPDSGRMHNANWKYESTPRGKPN